MKRTAQIIGGILLMLLGLFFLAAAIFSCVPDSTETTDRPVMGGRQATDQEFNSTVALLVHGDLHCTGTVIASRVVITAAHCVLMNYYTEVRPPEHFRIMEKTLDAYEANPANTYEVEKVVSHEAYPCTNPHANFQGMGEKCDIALIITKKEMTTPWAPIPEMENFYRICPAGTSVIISGYGRNDDWVAGLLFIGNSIYWNRSNFEVWIGGEGIANPCYGDSGGPIYLDYRGERYVIGAASRLGNGLNCGDGAIYTWLPAYKGWIVQNADGLYPPPLTEDATAIGHSGGCSTGNNSFSFMGFAGLALFFLLRRKKCPIVY